MYTKIFRMVIFGLVLVLYFLKINLFKGCARYIFASLLCMSKREHFWNKEKCFLFHFESSFRSWDNQILIFQIIKCHDVIKCLTLNKKHILLNNLGSKHNLVMKLGQFMYYYKRKFLIKKLYKKYGPETSSRRFLIFKESFVKRNLRRSVFSFGQILIVLLISI